MLKKDVNRRILESVLAFSILLLTLLSAGKRFEEIMSEEKVKKKERRGNLEQRRKKFRMGKSEMRRTTRNGTPVPHSGWRTGQVTV